MRRFPIDFTATRVMANVLTLSVGPKARRAAVPLAIGAHAARALPTGFDHLLHRHVLRRRRQRPWVNVAVARRAGWELRWRRRQRVMMMVHLRLLKLRLMMRRRCPVTAGHAVAGGGWWRQGLLTRGE